MDSQAAITALAHLGINDAKHSVSNIPDGGSILLRSETGSTVTLLRRHDKYDILVVGAQPDCPVPALRAVLETAVLPLSDDYAARIGVALPERDALRKRIREASVALDVIAKGRLLSVEPPKIPMHQQIKRFVEAGASSVDHLPDNFADELLVLNQLQANVIVWSKEVDRLVQISRKGPETVLTAEEETVFWSTLDAALSAAQHALSSKTVKISLDILARKRRATGFLIDANNSLDSSRRKAAGVLTLIQGLPIVALRTAEDLPSLRKGVVTLLEHIAAKLRISSFSVERMLSLLDSMGSDVNRSIGRILAEKGDLLRLPFPTFVEVFEGCCDLFESWSQGFDSCRRVAREAARKKNESMPPRRRSPLSKLYSHLTEVYELRSDHQAIYQTMTLLSQRGSQSKRLEKVDSAFSALVKNCNGLNHFDLNTNDEARWIKLRGSYRSEMADVEGFLARDYATFVRQGNNMRTLAMVLQPFEVALEKHFMAAATAKAVGDVVSIGRSDLKVLQERATLLSRVPENQDCEVPPICTILSECHLLNSRAVALKQHTAKVLGKSRMEVIPEVVEFISAVERLREGVNPRQRFKSWLDGVDMNIRTQPLLTLERTADGIAVISVSIESDTIWFPRVLRMAKENAELTSYVSARHQEFSRFLKAIFRTYSMLEEALTGFNDVSQHALELDNLTHLRIYPLLEPLQDAAREVLEEGFTTGWDSPVKTLQDYASMLISTCGYLWSAFHILLESDSAFFTSYHNLLTLNPVLDRGGQLCAETQTHVHKIFGRMSMARASLGRMFSERIVENYLLGNWIPFINSALVVFIRKQTVAWFDALKHGNLDFEIITLDAAPSKEGKLHTTLIPGIEEFELTLIGGLGSAYESFAKCLLKAYEAIRTKSLACGLSSVLQLQCQAKGEHNKKSFNEALSHVSSVILRILRLAKDWNQHVVILQTELRCDARSNVHSLTTCKEKLEEFTAMYEDITSLREKDESLSASGESCVFHDSRILSAKLLAKIRADLIVNCDRITAAASEASQNLYKKVSYTKGLLADLSSMDITEALISLQLMEEEIIPSCLSTLKVLSALEGKFDNIAERTGDSSFACAQSAETWILSDSLNAHFKDLTESYERRRAAILASYESLNKKYVHREEAFRTKLTSLFEDFQNIRNDSSEEETFIDTDSLIQDLEHQLNRLDDEGSKLEKLARALGLSHKPDTDGPKDILLELKRVKEGYAGLAHVEESMHDIAKVTLLEADPPTIRSRLDVLSEKVDHIAQSSGAKKAARRLQERISKVMKGLSLFGALKSVRLSPPRERDLLKRLLSNDHAVVERVRDLPLAVFMDASSQQHETYIRQVLENAAGEASICDFITSVERTWARRKCTFRWYDGVPIVESIPDMLDELDEHLQALETMASSQHAKIFESERSSWETRLGNCREQLELLSDVQGRWAHIRTLFGSQPGSGIQGLRKELQEEFTAFTNVHARFSSVGDRLRYAPGLLEGMESSFGLEDMKRELQGIVRGLSRFLEHQRSCFPRFFFLPDDDLLQVLSVSPSDVATLLPHIGKLFPAIHGFQHRTEGTRTEIYSVSSREGEVLYFANPIRVTAQEGVAIWLQKLQSELTQSLKEAASLAMTELVELYGASSESGDSGFVKAYLKFPAQVSLLVLRFCFTRTVESCLKAENLGNSQLCQVLLRTERLLDSISSFAAHKEYLLGGTRRSVLVRSQIIKELVYQRDIIRRLIDGSVNNVSSPHWDHNIRVYSEGEQDGMKLKVILRCGLSEFEYGWEYLGIGETLVHTELTSRCFLTLSECLRRGYGGSPFGPAGTGKTETVKAFGRSLGRFVAVFNCDEAFDSVSVGRILAGVCRIGCWVCFDEFNRLSAGILSSTSEQLASLQACIRKHEDSIQNFYGGDLPVVVKPGVGVFVTMNPTYSGRRELPANLKSLFRPCAMAKPDSTAIAEVLLLTCGFRFASSLSKKMVTLFDSLQATVSHQPHYDFGLRSLKTTILASTSLVQGQSNTTKIDRHNEGVEEEVLIRGIEEVVKPKLTPSDVLEYEVAIRSIFTEAACLSPGLPPDLEETVQEVMTHSSLLPTKDFMEKLRQLYWLMQHQSGVMLIGETGSGKSAVWRTLHEALRRLSRSSRNYVQQRVLRVSRATLTVLDPKLLSASQLYGYLDPITREWTDGLFTKTLRRINGDLNEECSSRLPLHWIVFDGDVDPVWAENLNSVLDDNRILTLPNGEQIPLLENTRVLFEAKDLDHANPSTVSRCGMICFAETMLPQVSLKMSLSNSYKEFCDSTSVPACLDDIADLVVSIAKRTIESEGLVMVVPIQSIVRSTSTLLRSCLEELKQADKRESETSPSSYTVSNERSYVSDTIFFRSLVVSSSKSLCAGLSHVSRLRLVQSFFEKLMKLEKVRNAFAEIAVPPDLSDVTIDADGALIAYHELVPTIDTSLYHIDAGNPDIVIPTPTTVRLKSFLQDTLKLTSTNSSDVHPLLLCGPPGCGKSLLLTAALKETPNVSLCALSFSSETSHEQVLSALKGYTETSRRPNGGYVLRPKSSGYRVVLFCDEVNLEKPDPYDTQRSVSLLRSMAEHGGFWDGSSGCWLTMEDIYIVAACNPDEDAGRNKLSSRFLSHCSVVRVEQPNSADLQIIYGVFVKSLLGRVHESLTIKADQVASAMIDFFTKNKKRFCPEEHGPLLSHYIYSPRELSRWVRGLKQLLIDSNRDESETGRLLSIEISPESTWKDVVLAFCYEARRLFIDRLPNSEERRFAEDALEEVVKERLQIDTSWLLDLLYTSWQNSDVSPVNSEKGDSHPRFQIVRDPEEFRKLIYRKLRVFAEEEGLGGSWLSSGGSPSVEDSSAMIDQFAVTDEVLTHLTRIERILCNPLGHAVLMGAPGTGKKTLARFAAWMLSMDIHQVHSHASYSQEDFAQDLRYILRKAGVQGKKICLIFDESHAMESGFLEVMNSLLACGDVPGLFSNEERASLLDELRSANVSSTSSAATEHMLYAEFINRVRNFLHIIFTTSSSADSSARRSSGKSSGATDVVSERSPALYNRCTADWIGDWAMESLEAVAELKIEVSLGHEKEQIIRSAVQLHKLTREHFKLHHSRVAITPRHFLEFIEQLNRIALEKGGEIQAGVERHTEGLRRLRHAGTVVDELKDSLEEKALRLQQKEANANDMLKKMVEEQRLAEKSKVGAEQLALAAAEASAAVKIREEEVAEQLAEVQPKVEAAREAVGSIRKEFLEELRGMPHPPAGARLALEGVMMLLDASQKKPDNQYSWGSIRSRMRGSDFISSVVNFDARNVPKGLRHRIQAKILKNPDYDVQKISFASRAAGPLAEWTLAVLDFAAVVEAVEPLQVEVSELHDEQEELQKQQIQASEEVQRFEIAIERCKADYAVLVSEAEKVRQEIKESESNLRRSEEMLDSLADEWDRWVKDLNEFNEAAVSVWGNSVLGAAFLSYAGALDHINRLSLCNMWKTVLRKESIPFDDDLEISTFLTSAHERGCWSSRGLQTDSTSLENYAILKRSARFPLIVDPTRQNPKALRKILGESSLGPGVDTISDSGDFQISETSFSLTEKRSYMRALESAMRFGTSLVLEDADNFDLAVLPLLGQESSYGDATKFAESLSAAHGKRKDSGSGNSICRRVVRLGQRDVFLSPSFRMYMSTVSLDFMPQAAITRSNVVSFELSPDALGSSCISTALAILSPETEKKRREFLVAALHNQERKRQLEEEVLVTVNNVEDLGTELLRGSLLDNLSNLKREVQILTRRQKEEEEASAEIRRCESLFAPLGQTAIDIYYVLQRLRLLDSLYEFDTAFFMRTFERTMHGFAALGYGEDDRVESCQRVLLRHSYVEIACRLFPRDRLPFAAAISLVTLSSFGLNDTIGNVDVVLEPVLKAWGRSLSSTQAKSMPDEERISSVTSLLPTHLRTRLSNAGDLENGFSAGEKINLALEVLQASLWEPHRLSKAVDHLACTLPGKDELIHSNETSPDFALRKEVSKYANAMSVNNTGKDLFAPMLLCSKGTDTDPSSVITKLAAELQLCLISLSMGSSSSDDSVSHAVNLACEKSDRGVSAIVVLKNMHLASKEARERLIAEVTKRNGQLSFLLIVALEVTSDLSISLLMGGLTYFKVLAFEALPSFRSNLSRSLTILSSLRDEGQHGEPRMLDRLQVLLSWLHACLLERATHSPIGFKKAYDFSDGDLSAAWDVLVHGSAKLLESVDGVENLINLLSNAVYGSRVEYEADCEILLALVTEAFDFHRVRGTQTEFVEVFAVSGVASSIMVPLEEKQRYQFIRSLPLEANPDWVHMSQHAPHRKHALEGFHAMEKILRLVQERFRETTDKENDVGTGKVKTTMELMLQEGINLQNVPELLMEDNNRDPIHQFWATESSNLRTVVESIKEQIMTLFGDAAMTAQRTQQLSMLREELDVSCSHEEAQVPDMWKTISPFHGKATSLAAFFAGIRLTIDCVRTYILNNERLPINLSGISRPKALIVALQYKEAAQLEVPPHSLRAMLRGAEECSSHDTLISGISVCGARWDQREKVFHLCDEEDRSATYSLSWNSALQTNNVAAIHMFTVPFYYKLAGDFLCMVDIPAPKSAILKQWRLRGVSLFLL